MINSTNTVNIDGVKINEFDINDVFATGRNDNFGRWVVRPLAIVAAIGVAVAAFFASAKLIVVSVALLPLLAVAMCLESREEIPEEVLPFVASIDALLQKNSDYNLKQRRFIADAAHELRTPITALSLEVDNLQKAQSDNVRQVRETSLKHSIGRLHRLVNQLLDLARAQSVVSEAVKPVYVNELLKTQIADLFLLAEEKNVELVVAHNEDLYVNDINNQLQHLLRNALSNAIKFSPPSSLVTIELRQQGSSAIFSVTDTGPGVENDHLKKLHEPFYRPAEQATGTGAGLGLAICHEIAQKLGGNLTLDNADGGGFRFQYSQTLVAKSGKTVKRIDD